MDQARQGTGELVYRGRVLESPYLIRKYGVTEEEYDQLTDEDTKAELLDGVLIIHSPASTRHETLFMFLISIMNMYVETKGLGRVLGSRQTIHLAYCRKFEPDILFLKAENLKRLGEAQIEGPADVVMEIISENTRDYDLREKRRVYQESGIPEIWFIDEERRRIEVDRKIEEGYETEVVTSGRVESGVISGFFVEAEWLWEKTLPSPLSCLQKILH